MSYFKKKRRKRYEETITIALFRNILLVDMKIWQVDIKIRQVMTELYHYKSECLLHSTFMFNFFVDRCPVFNIGAKKLDTTSCFQTKCPPYNYLSNEIDAGMLQ